VSTAAPVSLCVLASSSAGNCSALVWGEGAQARVVLIDAGLSPRQTRRGLSQLGIHDRQVAGIVLTHLDSDHFNPGWLSYLRRGTPIWVHGAHTGRAERDGILFRRTEVFGEHFEPLAGLRFHAAMVAHDDLGVACFRVTTPTGRSLGYATDVGRPDAAMCEHLAGVEVLAIESNYCPRLQLASDRPEFLKRRIMGGSGHLSNEQAADVVRRIAPHEHVVLLHLSVQCNRPEIAAAAHTGHGAPVTISRPDGPTPLIPLDWPGASPPRPRVARSAPARSLWEMASPAG
jgi:phosphoribosyl 1,2-cyclic phosphodiesterase